MQAARRTTLRQPGQILFWLVAITAVSLDQWAKSRALEVLEPESPKVVIESVLSWTLVFNPGAAFSLGENFTAALAVIAIAVSGYLIYVSLSIGSRIWGIALGLIFAGAFGNLLDRLFREPGVLRGHVIDFIEVTFINFPVFNIADMCLTTGAIVIVIQSFRGIGLNGEKDE